ncbi:hypothetical protein GOV05_05680 [Candidatus Woesearchaeota archaeon]|nr:hypothetical protein [Candidatus Woesearchaeota archaeon]
MEIRDQKVMLSVFEVEGTTAKKLEGLVKELGTNYEAYYAVEVTSVKEVPGLYRVEKHRQTKTDKTGLVRVVGRQIWTSKYDDMISTLLRHKSMPYTKGVVQVNGKDTLIPKVRPFTLEGKVETYTPKK